MLLWSSIISLAKDQSLSSFWFIVERRSERWCEGQRSVLFDWCRQKMKWQLVLIETRCLCLTSPTQTVRLLSSLFNSIDFVILFGEHSVETFFDSKLGGNWRNPIPAPENKHSPHLQLSIYQFAFIRRHQKLLLLRIRNRNPIRPFRPLLRLETLLLLF